MILNSFIKKYDFLVWWPRFLALSNFFFYLSKPKLVAAYQGFALCALQSFKISSVYFIKNK